MEEEIVEQPVAVHILVMPSREDCRVHIELEDCICALFSREDVSCAHVRDIREDSRIFVIWCTVPHDMATLMRHVISALTLIQSL